MVARYGGEEFITLFPNTTTEGAMEIAYRIHEEISGLNIPHKTSPISSRVTFSMGIATLIPDHNTSPEDLIQHSDKALYKAKKQGRNQIIIYRPDQ